MPAEAVHDRDRVDEDVERPGPRPQREHEAERDDVEPAAPQHVVERRLDDGVDGLVGEQAAGEVEDRVADVVDLAGVELAGDVADRTGEREDQRRHGQDGEERRLGGQAGHPVAQAAADRGDDEPPDEAPRARCSLGRSSSRCSVRHASYGIRMAEPHPGDIRSATNQVPLLVGHNVVTADAALSEAVVRHAGRRRPRVAGPDRRRGRHRGGARARPAGQRAPPGPAPVRPLRPPRRRGRLPPVLALADGARHRARARRDPVGAPGRRRRARPRPPRRRLHGVVAHRARSRLPRLHDVRRHPGAARRRRDRQGVDPAAGLHRLRPGAPGAVDQARPAGRHGHDREAGRLGRAGQRHRGPAHGDRRHLHAARPQVVHLGADERRLPRARPGRGRRHLLPRPARAARRHPQPARRRPAQGQARQPLQRVVGARAGRHRRRSGSATRAAASARSSRWSPPRASTASAARPR